MIFAPSASRVADRVLQSRVTNHLFGQHIPNLRKVDVKARQGVVTLRGRVNFFHQKQLCLNCCLRVAGVQRIEDRIEVNSALFDNPLLIPNHVDN
jgi:osmotically-inducible protein OsmY